MAADLGATVSQGQSVGLDEPVILPETVNAIEVRQVSEENQGDKSSGITGDEEIGNTPKGKEDKNRQRAPSSSNHSSDDLPEDYRKSVTKVIGMLEEMKQQMERLPDMSKPEHETLYNQLSSIDTSLESIANELHFIREWIDNDEIRKQPPPLNAGVVIHAEGKSTCVSM